MPSEKLSGAARIGVVSLTVSDLDRSTRFYEERLGFQVHRKTNGIARLGAGKRDLLELVEIKNAIRSHRTTGLYHFAVLVPDRFHLAKTLRHLGEAKTPMQGFSDHLVSEAIYLPDPDGNGIEIYRDRPRTEWARKSDGSLQMGNAPLDIDGLMRELESGDASWHGLHEDTTIGHMHLHVSNLKRDEAFYMNAIGLNRMLHFGTSASFLSAGGYHHHLGINTWVGAGAPPPPEKSVGLRWFEILLPEQAELDRVEERVNEYGLDSMRNGNILDVKDHSANGVRIIVGVN